MHRDSSNQLFLGVLGDAEPVGLVSFSSIDLRNRHCEIGVAIGAPERRGVGLGRNLTIEAIKFSFDFLNLHKVYGYVHADNIAALKMVHSIPSVTQTGMRPAHVFKHGRYVDVVEFSCLRTDWLKAGSAS